MPQIHGDGGASPGGGLIGLLDILQGKMFQILEPGGGFEMFPGLHVLGANIHPLLVHYPIALLSSFFLLEILGTWTGREKISQAASAMLYLGALGALAAVGAGLYAANTVAHGQEVHEIMEWHEYLGLTVASLATVLSVWRLLVKKMRSGMEKAFYFLLAFIMMASMIVGADLGGLMVYGHGVAVKSLQQSDFHHHL